MTETALVEPHADPGEGLLPWVAALVVVAAVLLWWNFREIVGRTSGARAPKRVAIVLAATARIAAMGTTAQAIPHRSQRRGLCLVRGWGARAPSGGGD